MDIYVTETKEKLGQLAAEHAIQIIKKAISNKGHASLIIATGASQNEVLRALVSTNEIDWSKVSVFHLDEYINLPKTHPASFRKFLKDNFIDVLPPLKEVYFVNGDAEDPMEECKRLSEIISRDSIDVAFVGIGENGHLAFNDPPANFVTNEPYIVVELDERCRKQQVGEGCFPSLEEVPRKAISMSVRQVMKSQSIICSVPDQRKAEAVKNCLENEISNWYPSSILRQHPDCSVFLDRNSSALLSEKFLTVVLKNKKHKGVLLDEQ
jgi:glucosamine-6-phosphate deaminase